MKKVFIVELEVMLNASERLAGKLS